MAGNAEPYYGVLLIVLSPPAILLFAHGVVVPGERIKPRLTPPR